jgi:hypothetical protein
MLFGSSKGRLDSGSTDSRLGGKRTFELVP